MDSAKKDSRVVIITKVDMFKANLTAKESILGKMALYFKESS